ESFRLEALVRAHQGVGRGPLQKGSGLAINRASHEVVCGGVSNIQMDGGIEFDDFDEIRLAEIAGLAWRTALTTGEEHRAKDDGDVRLKWTHREQQDEGPDLHCEAE